MTLLDSINSLFKLTPEMVTYLKGKTTKVELKKNSILLNQGQQCHYLYFIRQGLITSTNFSEGKEICNWIATENDYATSYYSLMSGKPSYELIRCAEKSLVEKISIESINQFYSLYPSAERIGRLIIEAYYLRAEERFIAIQFKSAKERYSYLLEKRPEIVHRAPLGKLASYLGMTLETLSRVRSEI